MLPDPTRIPRGHAAALKSHSAIQAQPMPPVFFGMPGQRAAVRPYLYAITADDGPVSGITSTREKPASSAQALKSAAE